LQLLLQLLLQLQMSVCSSRSSPVLQSLHPLCLYGDD
jgi:hypothetical protein